MVNVIQYDLQCLTGKVVSGDLTPLVFDLLKGGKGMEEFINVSIEHEDNDTSEDCCGGIDFTQWLSDNGKPVSI